MSTLWHDLKLSLRSLARRPLFALVCVVSLSLGLGANSFVFTLIQAVLIRPLPYPDLERLTLLRSTSGSEGTIAPANQGLSRFEFFSWVESSRSFASLGAVGGFGPARFTDENPADVSSASATADFFRTLGVDRVQGRTFLAEDGIPGAQRVAIISHRLWRSRFRASSDAVGQFVQLDEEKYQVVGILPAGFHVLYHSIDVWVPMEREKRSPSGRRAHDLLCVGLLKNGVGIQQANAELASLQERIFPAGGEGRRGADVQALQDYYLQSGVGAGQLRQVLWLLSGVMAIVLLIGCFNVGTLILARSISRRAEVVMRMALGASRRRIWKSQLTESALLGCGGGIAGLFLALWLGPLVISWSPHELDRFHPQANALTVLATLGASLCCGILLGSLPAALVSRTTPRVCLSDGSGVSAGPRPLRLFRLLVLVEVALSLVLLIGAGLMINSLARLSWSDPGFRPEGLWLVDLELPESRYALLPEEGRRDPLDRFVSPRLRVFLDDALRRLHAVPGVSDVSMTTDMLDPVSLRFRFAGQPDDPLPLSCAPRPVSPNYFRVMGIPIQQGRSLGAEDSEKAPSVAVLDERAFPRHWERGGPVGQQIVADALADVPLRIVGLVKEVRPRGLAGFNDCSIYVPFSQLPPRYSGDWRLHLNFVVRAGEVREPDPQQIRAALVESDPLAHLVVDVRRMTSILSGQLAERRFYLSVLASFAGIAIVLAMTGVYGVLTHSLRQRRREFGIRRALGASSSNLLLLALRGGAAVAVAGCLAGLVGAFVLSRFLSAYLFGITATDPLTFVVSAILLLAMALIACWTPSRRASKMEPIQALRTD